MCQRTVPFALSFIAWVRVKKKWTHAPRDKPKVVFTTEQLAQRIRRSTALLVCIEGFIYVLGTDQEGLGAFLFGLVPHLARADRLQAQ